MLLEKLAHLPSATDDIEKIAVTASYIMSKMSPARKVRFILGGGSKGFLSKMLNQGNRGSAINFVNSRVGKRQIDIKNLIGHNAPAPQRYIRPGTGSMPKFTRESLVGPEGYPAEGGRILARAA